MTVRGAAGPSLYTDRAFIRDASFWRNGGGGSGGKHHAQNPNNTTWAACSARILLDVDNISGSELVDLENYEMCSRPACFKRWVAARLAAGKSALTFEEAQKRRTESR